MDVQMSTNTAQTLKAALPPIVDAVPNLKRKTADEMAGPCPKCGGDDRFIVWTEKNTFWCRQCEWKGDVIELHCHQKGLDFKGLAEKYLGNNGRKPKAKPDWKTVAEYVYHDHEGKLSRKVIKKVDRNNASKKNFPQMHWDGAAWAWGTKGIRAYPYHLQQLQKSSGTVFIVEGEKDVETLEGCGLVATCNPGGAGKWPGMAKDLNQFFKGRDVVILPDNDDAGRKHAEQVARSLYGVAKSIKVVELPRLPDKGDVSDFAAGYDEVEEAGERITDIVADAPFRTPAKEVMDNGVDIQDAPQLAKTEKPAIKFPHHVIGGAAVLFTDEMTAVMESPIEFFFFAYLTCLGNALSGKIWIDSELNDDPRMYTLLLGESARTRKSTAINKTVGLFESALTDYNVCRGIGSAEGLQEELKEYPNTLLVLDEFKAFVGKTKIQSSVLLPCVATLFHENRYKNRTKKNKLDIQNAHLSMLAASTPETFENTWDGSFSDIGFDNRLFIVPGKSTRKIAIPPRLPDATYQELRNDLGEVITQADKIGTYPIEADAMKLYNDWYQNRETSYLSRRLATYARRLMPLLPANDLRETIEADIIQNAIDIVEWQLQMRRLHNPIDAEGKVAFMEQKITRILERGAINVRALRQRASADRFGLWAFKSALNNLKEHDIVTSYKRETGKPGPNPTMYMLTGN